MSHFQHSAKAIPRFLIINPNTNQHLTHNIRKVINSIAPQGVMAVVTNPTHGPYSIETVQDKAEATQQVLALIETHINEGISGYIMACFDDLGIAEIRERTQAPAISLAEASIRHAAASGMMTVITTFLDAIPVIEALCASYGLSERCRVVATGVGVADTAAQTEIAEIRLHQAMQEAIELNSAAIVLGSGAFAGRAQALSARYSINVTDGFVAALDYLIQKTQLIKS